MSPDEIREICDTLQHALDEDSTLHYAEWVSGYMTQEEYNSAMNRIQTAREWVSEVNHES